MVDRASGRAVSCAAFDSRDAMERNREQSAAIKNAKIREASVEELDECEFDLALAHLRAPELVRSAAPRWTGRLAVGRHCRFVPRVVHTPTDQGSESPGNPRHGCTSNVKTPAATPGSSFMSAVVSSTVASNTLMP